MAEQAYAYVTLIPVAKGFKSSIEKELGGVGGIGGAVGADVGGRFAGGFGGALKNLAVVAGGALAAAGVGRFFSDSIKQASDLGESVNAVNKAYGDFAGDVLKLGGDVANRLGLSTVDFNQAAVRFSSFAGRIAGEGGNVAEVVDSLTTRAADFASVYNIEVSEALQVFQSGLSGEAEPLKRFGINLLDSEVKAYAYANGIAAVGSELSEAEKVQARYGLLLQETAKTQGDFADTSDGLANSQRILAANLENLKAQVGAGLTPVLATFTSALVPLANIVFPAIANFLNTYIVPGLQKAADFFKAFATNAAEGGVTIEGIFENIQGMLDKFLNGGGLDALFDRFAQMRESFFLAIQKALPGIIDGMVEFFPVLLDTAVKFFTLLIDALVLIIPPLVETLITLLPKLIDAMLTLLPLFIDGAVKLFMALVNAIDIILPPLIDAVIKAVPQIVNALVSALPLLVDGAIKLFTALLQGLEKILPDLIKAVLKLVPMIVDLLLKNIPLLIGAAIDLLTGLARGLIENAPRILASAIGAVGETLVEGIKDFLGIKSPSKVFYQVGENVTQGLANGIDDGIGTVVAAGDRLASATAGAADKINKSFENTYTIISSIPGVASTAMKETVRITESQVRRMAEEVEGLFAQFDKKGNLLTSYTGYGKSIPIPTKDGGMIDVGKTTDDLNALYNYMGAKTQEQILDVQKTLFGGTFQQAIDSLTGQKTYFNAKTGMTKTIAGELAQSEIDKIIASGFKPVEPLTTSMTELKDVIKSLSKQIDEKGLRPAGIPMATGGFVDKPTPALVGEAGPEVVMPLDRFEKMMGLDGKNAGKTLNYYAAPNQSIDSERDLFQAMRRARVVAQW